MNKQEPKFDGMTEQELDAKCCRLQIELLHREQDLRDFDIISE